MTDQKTHELIVSVLPGFGRWASTTEIRARASLKYGRLIPLNVVQAELKDLEAGDYIESKARGNGLAWRLR